MDHRDNSDSESDKTRQTTVFFKFTSIEIGHSFDSLQHRQTTSSSNIHSFDSKQNISVASRKEEMQTNSTDMVKGGMRLIIWLKDITK